MNCERRGGGGESQPDVGHLPGFGAIRDDIPRSLNKSYIQVLQFDFLQVLPDFVRFSFGSNFLYLTVQTVLLRPLLAVHFGQGVRLVGEEEMGRYKKFRIRKTRKFKGLFALCPYILLEPEFCVFLRILSVLFGLPTLPPQSDSTGFRCLPEAQECCGDCSARTTSCRATLALSEDGRCGGGIAGCRRGGKHRS